MQSLGTLCTQRPLLTGRGGGLPLLLLPTSTSRRSGSEDHRESLRERRESMPTREGRLLAGRSQSPGDNAQGVCGGVIPNPSPGGGGGVGDIQKQFLLPQLKGCYWHPVGRGRRCCYPSFDARTAPRSPTKYFPILNTIKSRHLP